MHLLTICLFILHVTVFNPALFHTFLTNITCLPPCYLSTVQPYYYHLTFSTYLLPLHCSSSVCCLWLPVDNGCCRRCGLIPLRVLRTPSPAFTGVAGRFIWYPYLRINCCISAVRVGLPCSAGPFHRFVTPFWRLVLAFYPAASILHSAALYALSGMVSLASTHLSVWLLLGSALFVRWFWRYGRAVCLLPLAACLDACLSPLDAFLVLAAVASRSSCDSALHRPAFTTAYAAPPACLYTTVSVPLTRPNLALLGQTATFVLLLLPTPFSLSPAGMLFHLYSRFITLCYAAWPCAYVPAPPGCSTVVICSFATRKTTVVGLSPPHTTTSTSSLYLR